MNPDKQRYSNFQRQYKTYMSKIVGNVDRLFQSIHMRNIVTTLLDVDGGDVAVLLRCKLLSSQARHEMKTKPRM